MYCLPPVRGTGMARQLMELCLDYAGRLYRQCYIETLHNMTAGQRASKTQKQRLPARLGPGPVLEGPLLLRRVVSPGPALRRGVKSV